VAGVEQPQLHQLVGHDVVDDLDADVLERRSPRGEVVLEDPLREGLADDGPRVLDAEPLSQGRDVLGRRHGGDPVDHAVGEGDVLLHPLPELGVLEAGEGDDHLLRHVAVAGQVVARHHGEGLGAGVPATPRGLDDEAEHAPRHTPVSEVRRQVRLQDRVVRVELTRHLVDVVAALGHGERHDPRRRVDHPRQDRVGVVGREEVVDHRPDDAGLQRPVRVLDDECVEVVLGRHRVAHACVARQEPDADDAPVEGLALVHQCVEIHGLVGAVEPADTEVDDARGDGRAVVCRSLHLGGQLPQSGLAELHDVLLT
jgi:hypothetical protein